MKDFHMKSYLIGIIIGSILGSFSALHFHHQTNHKQETIVENKK